MADTAAALAGITGIAGVITAVGGVLLAVRAARDKERRAAHEEIKEVGDMLSEERHARIEAERRVYDLTLLLARHGIETPE